jgi:polysaccharide biosynthesis/export protein
MSLHTKAVPEPQARNRLACLCLVSFLLLSGCTLPRSGPASDDIIGKDAKLPDAIRVVDITPDVVRELGNTRARVSFSSSFASNSPSAALLGAGDVIEVTIWEAPPATLFSSEALSARASALSSGSRGTSFPEQVIGLDGQINIPFAGPIQALGRTPSQIEQDIIARLRGKANQPQALVRQTRNNAALVTVVGEVTANTRMPLTPRGERLLDAIATAGGSKQPVHKTTVQVTRGTTTLAMPLDSIIREPQHNIALRAADVITLIHQPQSFTALGATGKNDEVNFEAQGITLAQALARVGGLQDARADAQGVFIFRMQPGKDPQTEASPTIYRLDLKNPAGFFLAQTFPIENRDILYVSNASAAELQKFANLIYTITLPAISTVNAVR